MDGWDQRRARVPVGQVMPLYAIADPYPSVSLGATRPCVRGYRAYRPLSEDRPLRRDAEQRAVCCQV